MPPPHISPQVEVRPIPDAGRGVVTAQPIAAGSLVHVSRDAPAVHVVFREYRREVCAACFAYDRGRTLPVRDRAVGKVFCADACRRRWAEGAQGGGELGVRAWRALESFVLAKRKKPVSTHRTSAHADASLSKPGVAEIEAAWSQAEAALSGEAGAKKVGRKGGAAVASWASSEVDSDVLSFLLSGVLFHHRHVDRWRDELLALAVDDQPYRNRLDLEAYCTSYQQLTAIVPAELRESATALVCRAVIGAAAHNAFGIRAGSDDNEEYLGYGVWPSASYFNHSCRPNIRKQRIGGKWEFRSMINIDSAGRECCITYLGGDEKDMSVSERRARLENTWGFRCRCERCLEEEVTLET